MTMIMRSRMVYVRPPAADCCPRCYQKTQPRWHLGAAICHSRSQTMKNTVESACLCEKLTWKAESMRANSWHKLSRQLRSKADWTQPHAVRFSQQVIPRIYTENVILAYSTIMNYMHTQIVIIVIHVNKFARSSSDNCDVFSSKMLPITAFHVSFTDSGIRGKMIIPDELMYRLAHRRNRVVDCLKYLQQYFQACEWKREYTADGTTSRPVRKSQHNSRIHYRLQH